MFALLTQQWHTAPRARADEPAETPKREDDLKKLILPSVMLVMVVGMMFVLPGKAQNAVEAITANAKDATTEDSVSVGDGDLQWFDFFVRKGGKITMVLIALSLVTVALVVEHFASIRRATILPVEATQRIKALIDEKKYLEAIEFTSEEPSMMGSVINAGLLEASNGYAAMERAVEETLEERAARLIRKTEYLSVIGNVSPMIGLFGTVVGMILLFASIHQAAAFPPARIVADKISIALITTFWGLLIAIFALSFFAIIRNRIDVLTAECALAADKILSVFKPGAAGRETPKPAEKS